MQTTEIDGRQYWKGMRLFTREEWKAPTKKTRATEHKTEKGSTLFVHYSAFGGKTVDSLEEQAAVMRSMYNYHTKNNGWVDIGYNFVVFQPQGKISNQTARVFEGRGIDRIPAAQEGANTGNIAVCVVCLTEDIEQATIDKIKLLYKRLPCTKVKGHRDVNDTGCPGDKLYKRLPEIRKAK